jgi:predicted permease
VEGYPPEEAERSGPQFNTAGPGYFRTLSIPFVAGRDFTDADNAAGPKVAIINETMARHYFPRGDAIGKRFALADPGAKPDIEIVGVVKDSRYVDLRETTPRYVYLPVAQREPYSLTLHVRTAGDPAKLAAMVRGAVRSLDPNLPVYDITTLHAQVDSSLAQERLMASLTTWFGGLATVLAAVGIYGILAFAVARRTREIGIRMALGAEAGSVLALVLRHTAVMVAAGLVLGVAGAAGVTRLIGGTLYGVKPLDPIVMLGACAVLAAMALAASYVPARRAALTDPLTALRHE